ncbi:MAG TPA: bifunctional phosphoglucose/phosphomannose isomerase [Candidatus Poseidoniia archaeon]|jgi:glucose/mannose-6-phosphate isomerase|nr:bifunctional phosphoglucose/phosphomannose isomerase [Candidatus Poseidoniia archaeon]
MQIEDDTLNFFGMWEAGNFVPIKSEMKQLIISGMGGSGIGGRILAAIADSEGFTKISHWNNYNLPKWANQNCSVICVSYSGNTAETLSAAECALDIGCNLEVITTGGRLKKIAEKNNLHITEIEKGHQPRAALPLLLKALIYRIGLPNLQEQINEVNNLVLPIVAAKNIASQLKGTIPCIYSSDLMNPVAYRWRCQIEENAKQLAFNHQIPEMNHNEIVGWTLPNNKMSVILIRDNNEKAQIKNRFEATKNVAWNEVEIVECVAEGKTPLTRIMSMIILGDLVSIELAKLNNIDPTPVEVIENLKNELGGK